MAPKRFKFYKSEKVDSSVAFAEHSDTGISLPSGSTKLARQDPPMDPIDELIFLLHTAAEIEHSLLAQYLYAAWSLPDRDPQRQWREELIGIAREEMGHLMSVQNVLLGLGAALNLEREDFPFNEFYPFPFRLEPLSVPLLARVVLAEMPDPAVIPSELGFDLAQVRADASEPDDVDRVGALFELIIEIVEEVGDQGLHKDSLPFQADPQDWVAQVYNLKLAKVGDSNQAITLLEQVAEQGEGHTEPDSGPASHFRRLFRLYNEARDFLAVNPSFQLADPVPFNPTVSDHDASGYLNFPEANAWGNLFNQKYHWVLFSLAHALTLDQSDPVRRELRSWSLEDMRRLSQIADLLRGLPKIIPPEIDEYGRPIVAGAPLELPPSLALPDRPADKWRAHLRFARHHLQQLGAVQDQTAAGQMIYETKARIDRVQGLMEVLQ